MLNDSARPLVNQFLDPLNHIKIIESEYLTEPGDPIVVRRTWRERLYSRPWRPWKSTKTITPQVPRKIILEAVINGRRSFIMHPVVARYLRDLRRQLERSRA